MSALYADHEGDNVSWTGDLPGYEPWEPDEAEPDEHLGLCGYCDEVDPAKMRENPEPFGGKPCCESCFLMLIGDEPDGEPWRCGTPASTSATPDSPAQVTDVGSRDGGS